MANTRSAHKWLPASKIAEIYLRSEAGQDSGYIAEKFGVDTGAVWRIKDHVTKYLNGGNLHQRRSYRNYTNAANMIRRAHERSREESAPSIQEKPVVLESTKLVTESALNPLEKLEAAQKAFQNSVVEFAIQMADQEVAKVRKENVILKEKLARLEFLEEKAKESNWMDSLIKRFGPEKVKSIGPESGIR